jgi:hypothetical protein
VVNDDHGGDRGIVGTTLAASSEVLSEVVGVTDSVALGWRALYMLQDLCRNTCGESRYIFFESPESRLIPHEAAETQYWKVKRSINSQRCTMVLGGPNGEVPSGTNISHFGVSQMNSFYRAVNGNTSKLLDFWSLNAAMIGACLYKKIKLGCFLVIAPDSLLLHEPGCKVCSHALLPLFGSADGSARGRQRDAFATSCGVNSCKKIMDGIPVVTNAINAVLGQA